MLDRDHVELSIRRQCRLLGIARSGVYYDRRPANDNALGVMRQPDELFTQWPFLGSRRLARLLRDEGHAINRKRAAADAQAGDRRPGPQAKRDQTDAGSTRSTRICCAIW